MENKQQSSDILYNTMSLMEESMHVLRTSQWFTATCHKRHILQLECNMNIQWGMFLSIFLGIPMVPEVWYTILVSYQIEIIFL